MKTYLDYIQVQAAEFTILRHLEVMELCSPAAPQVNITFSPSWKFPVDYLSSGLTSTKTVAFTARMKPRPWRILYASRIDLCLTVYVLIRLARICMRWTGRERSLSQILRRSDLHDIRGSRGFLRSLTYILQMPSQRILLKSTAERSQREWLL